MFFRQQLFQEEPINEDEKEYNAVNKTKIKTRLKQIIFFFKKNADNTLALSSCEIMTTS